MTRKKKQTVDVYPRGGHSAGNSETKCIKKGISEIHHDIFSELAKVDTEIRSFFEDKDNMKKRKTI